MAEPLLRPDAGFGEETLDTSRASPAAASSAAPSSPPPSSPDETRPVSLAPLTLDHGTSSATQNTFDAEDKTFVRWPGGSAGSAASIHIPGGSRKQFGDYELVRELARGGMGVVYEAIQTTLKRTVAVKMILSGEFASDEQIQRFFAEARSVANLDHPNIVPVYEVAEQNGLHFFSMKLVDGGSLSNQLSVFPGNVRKAAELIEKVSRAIHHAHQRGVLHRDLKPGNILLDRAGEPLVTDFGLAKIVADDSNVTRSDAVVGTPAYMAPEQARGARYATTATDIWALGVILYQLLTGAQPFKGETSHETLRLVTESEPIGPRQRNPRVPRDLETICIKCLQKEPARRYATADALAADLRRFLAGEPVEARPVGTHERVWRWCRRNPGLAATSATALAAAAAAIVILSVSVVLISEREREATKLANENAVLLDSERTLSRARERDNITLRLEQAIKQCELDAPAGLLTLCRVLQSAERIDAQQLALSTRLQISTWASAIHPLRCVVRHEPAGAGGVRLVTASADGAIAYTEGADNCVRAFDTQTGKPIGRPLENNRPASVLAVDPATGILLIGFRDGTAAWWHPDPDRKLPPAAPHHAGGQAITAIAFAGGRVLTCGQDGVARFWSTATGRQDGPELQHGSAIAVCAVSEYSDRCATGGEDGSLRIWRLATGEPQGQSQQLGKIWAISFRDLYRQLAVITQNAAVLHDAGDGRPLETLRQPPGGAFAMSLSPDGQRVLVAEWGSIARVTTLSGPPESRAPLRHGDNVTALAVSHDGRTMITGSVDGTARIWSLAGDPGRDSRAVMGAPTACLSRDGMRIAVGTSDGAVVVLNAGTQAVLAEIREDLPDAGGILSIAISPDGARVLVASIHETARLYDVASRKPVGDVISHADRVNVAAFSPDGSYLMSGSFDGQLQIRRSADLAPIGPPIDHELLRTAAFSPDGKFVVTAGEDGIARLWQVRPDRGPPLEFHHDARIWAVAFSPDQERLATAGQDGLARLWDLKTAAPIGQPMAHQDQVQLLAFSPAGDWLATGEPSRVVRLWDARTGQARLQPIALPDQPTCFAFSDDGARLVVGVFDGSVVLWDVTGHRAIGPILHKRSTVSAVGFTPGGNAAMIATLGGDVRLHRVSPQSGGSADIAAWASTLTGLRLDDAGAVRVIQDEPRPGR